MKKIAIGIWVFCVIQLILSQTAESESELQMELTMTDEEKILKIVRGKYNPIPTTYSKELSNMVDRCLCKDQRKRPSIHEILE